MDLQLVAITSNSGEKPRIYGKEGVDGSSPSEGLLESPANGHIVLPAMARFGFFAGTRRVHFGTGGHSRAFATSPDLRHDLFEILDRDHRLGKFLQTGSGVARLCAKLSTSFASEGS
jgi:hypothetical protein